jgi:hypothetical protein
VYVAQALQGLASSLIGPGIAAISLGNQTIAEVVESLPDACTMAGGLPDDPI